MRQFPCSGGGFSFPSFRCYHRTCHSVLGWCNPGGGFLFPPSITPSYSPLAPNLLVCNCCFCCLPPVCCAAWQCPLFFQCVASLISHRYLPASWHRLSSSCQRITPLYLAAVVAINFDNVSIYEWPSPSEVIHSPGQQDLQLSASIDCFIDGPRLTWPAFFMACQVNSQTGKINSRNIWVSKLFWLTDGGQVEDVSFRYHSKWSQEIYIYWTANEHIKYHIYILVYSKLSQLFTYQEDVRT